MKEKLVFRMKRRAPRAGTSGEPIKREDGLSKQEMLEDLPFWPRELIELSIASDLSESLRVLRSIISDRANGKSVLSFGYKDVRESRLEFVNKVVRAIGPSEFAELAQHFHSVNHEEMDVPEASLHRLGDVAKAVLLSGLNDAPQTKEEHRARVTALSRIPWLGKHASEIHRGWIPLFERSARLLDAYAGKEDRVTWQTDQIKEKFGTLRWYTSGGRVLQTAAGVTMHTSDFCCIACGRDARLDASRGSSTACCGSDKS